MTVFVVYSCGVLLQGLQVLLFGTTRLFWQDKWKSLPKIGGNLFGLYLLAKMLIQLTPEYFAYYKKTSTRVKKIMAIWSIIGKVIWLMNIKWQVSKRKKIQDQANKNRI